MIKLKRRSLEADTSAVGLHLAAGSQPERLM